MSRDKKTEKQQQQHERFTPISKIETTPFLGETTRGRTPSKFEYSGPETNWRQTSTREYQSWCRSWHRREFGQLHWRWCKRSQVCGLTTDYLASLNDTWIEKCRFTNDNSWQGLHNLGSRQHHCIWFRHRNAGRGTFCPHHGNEANQAQGQADIIHWLLLNWGDLFLKRYYNRPHQDVGKENETSGATGAATAVAAGANRSQPSTVAAPVNTGSMFRYQKFKECPPKRPLTVCIDIPGVNVTHREVRIKRCTF